MITLTWLLALLVTAVVGWYAGLIIGIKETEERWSDAVGRAEDARKRSQQ